MPAGGQARLGPRLEAVARLVPPGRVVADIGSDHARLPVHLVAAGKAPRAIAGELGGGPYLRARRGVDQAGMSALIDVRRGNGLTVLRPGEAGVVVLAGMGGRRIASLLGAAPPEVVSRLERLVLQPMEDVGWLRNWLTSRGYTLCDEELAREGRHFYHVVSVRPAGALRSAGASDAVCPVSEAPEESWPRWLVLDLGPCLLRRGHPLLPALIRRRLAANQRIRRRLAGSAGHGADRARGRLREERRWLVRALRRLQDRAAPVAGDDVVETRRDGSGHGRDVAE